MAKVTIHFEGSIELDVRGHPDDPGFDDRVAAAWAKVKPREISEAAEVTSEDVEKCHVCNEPTGDDIKCECERDA